MAKNLRAKIPAADTLIIRDVNEETAKRFAAEAHGAAVEIAQNAREVAEKSVSVMSCSIQAFGWHSLCSEGAL